MLSKYRIVRRIGLGSFGEVFEVNLISTGETFAMKKIPNIYGREKLFETEIRVMMKTSHPNIVRIIEYFYDEDNEGERLQHALYIVMEYCCDGDLFNYVSHHKKLGGGPSQEDVISIIRQILYGCMALNQKGILHRDLKPENILLNGPTVKIGDFGCAKLIDVMNTYRYTSKSFNIGTPMYSAPEILNMQAYDDRCDVWSLGVIVYFMIYATVPFLEKDVKRLKIIIAEKTKAHSGLIQLPENPEIGQPLRELIRGMLKFKQEQRLTWTEIIGLRIFQPIVEYPSRFVSYLIQVVKVLGWVVQSLLLNFRQFYPAEPLSRLCHCVNLFIVGREELMCKITTKDPTVEDMFPMGRLDLHEFEVQLLMEVQKCNERLESYIEQTTELSNNSVQLSVIFEKDKSDRYYLWRAQKKARKLMMEAYSNHKNSQQCLRSIYCLALIAGYDRLLGQHEYLKLNSSQLCSFIKHCPPQQLRELVNYELTRLT